MYTIICETDCQSRFDARDALVQGCSELLHWDDPEGWDGEGGGKGFQDGKHMYTHG